MAIQTSIDIDHFVQCYNKYRKLLRTEDLNAKKEYTRNDAIREFQLLPTSKSVAVCFVVGKINKLTSISKKIYRRTFTYLYLGKAFIMARILLEDGLLDEDRINKIDVIRKNAFSDTDRYDEIFGEKNSTISVKCYKKIAGYGKERKDESMGPEKPESWKEFAAVLQENIETGKLKIASNRKEFETDKEKFAGFKYVAQDQDEKYVLYPQLTFSVIRETMCGSSEFIQSQASIIWRELHNHGILKACHNNSAGTDYTHSMKFSDGSRKRMLVISVSALGNATKKEENKTDTVVSPETPLAQPVKTAENTSVSLKDIGKALSKKLNEYKERKEQLSKEIALIEAKEEKRRIYNERMNALASRIRKVAEETRSINEEKAKIYQEILELDVAS